MIITCKKEIPRRWTIFAILPWASFTFNSAVVGVAFLFSLKKFIENPAGLTFILSLPGLLALFISPVASFLSDRIWTRVGRRKPFVIASWTGMLLAMILMPLAPNFWCLLAAFMLYHFAYDFNSPMEPLKQEIIPPHERGWATGAMQWCSNLATMVFYFIMLGRFDDVSFLAGFPLDGEAIIYWSAALMLLVLLLLIMLGIREIDQKSSIRGQRLTLHTFVGGLLDRELWPVYLLVFGNACMNFGSGLGALSNLLYTDQWGYSKQEMGVNVAVGGVINIFIIGLLTAFADRLNRMKAYQTVLCLSLVANIAYYGYVEFVLPDKRPSLVEIIVFGECLSILGILTALLYIPLVYDYVRRNRMGTYAAGASIVTRLTLLITLNGVGLFVTGYATLFQPPAGEMARIVLRDEVAAAPFLSSLYAAGWPSSLEPDRLAANVWQANGVVATQGRTWEIRKRDESSERLAKERKTLDLERSALLSKMGSMRNETMKLTRERAAETSSEEAKIADLATTTSNLSARIEDIDNELENRAAQFRQQVTTILAGRLILEGDQILAASATSALIIEITLDRRPDGKALESLLDGLRLSNPQIIDLRPIRHGNDYSLALSAHIEPGSNEAMAAKDLLELLKKSAHHRLPGAISEEAPLLSNRIVPVANIDLLVVENPVDSQISPITKVVNALLATVNRSPSPTRRLDATARNLRDVDRTNHVRAVPGPVDRSISVSAVLQPQKRDSAIPDDAIAKRITSLLGLDNHQAADMRELYERISTSAALQRITVARPVLSSGYAPVKYDYMSGYLCMFLMGAIGIALTMVFQRLERRGIVRKRGVEEAMAS